MFFIYALLPDVPLPDVLQVLLPLDVQLPGVLRVLPPLAWPRVLPLWQ
jgi:hypothetical protein